MKGSENNLDLELKNICILVKYNSIVQKLNLSILC